MFVPGPADKEERKEDKDERYDRAILQYSEVDILICSNITREDKNTQ